MYPVTLEHVHVIDKRIHDFLCQFRCFQYFFKSPGILSFISFHLPLPHFSRFKPLFQFFKLVIIFPLILKKILAAHLSVCIFIIQLHPCRLFSASIYVRIFCWIAFSTHSIAFTFFRLTLAHAYLQLRANPLFDRIFFTPRPFRLALMCHKCSRIFLIFENITDTCCCRYKAVSVTVVVFSFISVDQPGCRTCYITPVKSSRNISKLHTSKSHIKYVPYYSRFFRYNQKLTFILLILAVSIQRIGRLIKPMLSHLSP